MKLKNKSLAVQTFFDSHTGKGWEVQPGETIQPSHLCAVELSQSFPNTWEAVPSEVTENGS